MNFKELNEKYAGSSKEKDIKNLHRLYASRKGETLIDAMMASIGISEVVNGNSINYEVITPQMEEAFQMSFPNKAIEDLEGLDTEQLQGIMSNWKGKLFEVEVRDKLNDGEIVGDIVLDQGQEAVLAESMNQPGWDLQILNSDGTVNDFLQLKATESMGYINQALEKYPDIEILATSEVATLSQELQNSGITLDSLSEPLVDVLGTSTDFLDMVVPGLPFLIIAISETRKVFVKKTDWDQAFDNMASRGVKTGLALAAGWLMFDFTGIGWLAIASGAVFRWILGFLDNDDVIDETTNKKIEKIIPLIDKQNQELLLLKASYE